MPEPDIHESNLYKIGVEPGYNRALLLVRWFSSGWMEFAV